MEKLGSIAARRGEYGEVDVDQQVRAIQLLLSYGYGPPRPDVDRNDSGIVIQVIYAERNPIAIAGATCGATRSGRASETLQRGLLRPPLGEDRAWG